MAGPSQLKDLSGQDHQMQTPDLRPRFRHMYWRPEKRAFDCVVGSDKDFDPNCWSLALDEAGILYHCGLRVKGDWLVLGARLGWCSAHLAEAGCEVVAVDPELAVHEFADRFEENTEPWEDRILSLATTSEDYFKSLYVAAFAGFLIDGNHDAPCPLKDAQNCARHADETAVIVLHDALGQPIRDATLWLMDNGWHARWYDTPNGMFVCWRGDFVPPDHTPDPAIDWAKVRRDRAQGFPFERME